VTGGKDASAALPVEILRRACHQLHKGFKETRHGLFSHEASITIDPKVLKSTRDNLTTHDPIAAQVAAKLGEPKTKRKPGPDLPIDASKMSLAQWVEFWGNPTRGVLSSLNIEAPYLKSELHSDEVLDDPYAHGQFAAKNWVESFIKNTGREPSWDEAKLSGHFDTRDEGYDHFKATLDEANDANVNSAGEADTKNWELGIDSLFKDAPRPQIAANFRSMPVMFISKGWLAACTSKDLEEKNGAPIIQALALASALARNGEQLKGIVLIEPDETDKNGELKHGGAHAFVFQDNEHGTRIYHVLEALAPKAISETYAWGPKCTGALIWHAASGKFEGKKFLRGDKLDRHIALIAPAAYDYAESSRKFMEEFAKLGLKKCTRKNVEFKSAFGIK
jgi:hypothetical protein